MCALSICGNSLVVAAAGFLLWPGATASGQSCGPVSEIINNNMQYCAGSGDTLWVASYWQGWGLNYTTNRGKAWGGYKLGCYVDAVMTGIAFGGGTLAAILNPPDDEIDRARPTTVWHFTHATSRSAAFTIVWPDSVKNDTAVTVHARNAVSVTGNFYFACQHGGLVRWDPATDSLRGFLPGDTGSFIPAAFLRGQHPRFGTDSTAVLAVDRFGDTAIVAVTGPRCLLFDAARQIWDTSITSAFADTGVHFEAFSAAVVNNAVRPPILYAYVKYREAGKRSTSLFRYHITNRQWYCALSNQQYAVAPAVRGYLYVQIDSNQIEVFRDSVPDTAAVNPGGLKPVVTNDEFNARILGVDSTVKQPGYINDVLFLKKSDSTGSLCITTSDGLFVSWDENLGDSTVTGDLTHIKYVRTIKGGLAETYALPGIMTDDPNWPQASKTTFVYKLSRDGNVTIRIYDYNMQFVKTVIESAPRRAVTSLGLGRSTDSRFDVWDGTNSSGRPVAPGVYYYKITVSTGERSFGKIVVAKGQGK